MVTLKIGKHTVKAFGSIDELPILRFHKYQKLLLVDAGVGSDIEAFDHRLEKAGGFLKEGKMEQAARELENLRQTVFLIQSEVSLKHRAFAVLISEIDGEPFSDISDEGLEKVLLRLQDAATGELAEGLRSVKKKIDSELRVYFPRLFDNSEIKEYFDLLKARTVKILECIQANVPESAEIERLTNALLTYFKPQNFSGRESAEIAFDRQFEDLCLALSEQLHVRPKELTVLEFYNAFDFLQERARKAQKAAKNAR